MIASRFITTAHLKQDLVHPANLANYNGVVWSVIRSNDQPLISADNYGSCLLMVVSPHLALQGGPALKPENDLSQAEADELNQFSLQQASRFVFG
ncbi:hypothetical protein D9M68_924020 [compost metagenome]